MTHSVVSLEEMDPGGEIHHEYEEDYHPEHANDVEEMDPWWTGDNGVTTYKGNYLDTIGGCLRVSDCDEVGSHHNGDWVASMVGVVLGYEEMSL